ncbi:YggT family protein [Candidatus Peregrinibacteria bacterium]|nr:YggT family protein [Candidatus Peregrinibacteria bacterium]
MDISQVSYFFAQFVIVLSNLLTYAIIGRVIISWFSPLNGDRPQGRFSKILFDVTDPLLNLIKKFPHSIGMIDLSPIIALLAIDLLTRLILYIV